MNQEQQEHHTSNMSEYCTGGGLEADHTGPPSSSSAITSSFSSSSSSSSILLSSSSPSSPSTGSKRSKIQNKTSPSLLSTVVVDVQPSDRVVFSSDVEGNYDYFLKFIDSSNAFTRTESQTPETLSADSRDPLHKCSISLNPGYIFVFVGDVCDRGDGDCRLLFDLVHMKRSYPDRVFLIMGNRDMNKMRFSVELDPRVVESDYRPSVFWHSSAPATPWPSPVHKLKWILQNNMGSPDSFEHRRRELKLLFGVENPSDTDVYLSYMDLISPDLSSIKAATPLPASPTSSQMSRFSKTFRGLLTRYLQVANIAILIGDVLIVHGAVNEINLGWIAPAFRESYPTEWDPYNFSNMSEGDMTDLFYKLYRFKVDSPSTKQNDREELIKWLIGLDEFKNNEVQDYIDNCRSYVDFYVQQTKLLSELGATEETNCRVWSKVGSHLHYQPGSRLLAYGMAVNEPGTENINRINAGVIYSSYVSANNKDAVSRPCRMSTDTCRFLAGAGVSRVVVGHQPVGDLPLVINNGAVQVIMLDTSYSINVNWKADDISPSHDPHNISINSISDVFVGPPTVAETGAYVNAEPELVIKEVREALASRRSAISSSSDVSTSAYIRCKNSSVEYEIDPRNTRGFTVAHIEIDFKPVSELEAPFVVSDKCHFYGRLSNGYIYAHRLWSPTSSVPVLDDKGSSRLAALELRLSRLVGKRTLEGGWMLRSFGATKSYLFNSDSSTSLGSRGSDDDRGFVLLFSFTHGFSVFNRYVSNVDLERAGIDVDDPSSDMYIEKFFDFI